MKKRIEAAAREGTLKKGRKAPRKCPCCASAPCACERTCFCQELKAQMPDEGVDDAGFEEVLRFSFLRPSAQAV